MRWKKRLLIVVTPALLAAAALIGYEAGEAHHASACAPVKLPDGTVLTVHRVTFGTNHQIVFGSFFSKLWRQIAPKLPGGLRGRLPLHPRQEIGTFVTPNATLALWLYRTAGPTNSFSEDTFLEVADETGGVHLPKGRPSYQLLGPTLNSERVEAHIFDSFPRRAKTLTFYVYSVGTINGNRQWVQAGSFKLPNPAPGSFSAWKAEGLPARQQDGELELSLLRLQAKTNSVDEKRPLVNSTPAGTEALFRITRHGVPAPEWQVESLRVMDTTDNLLYLWAGAGGVSSNGFFFAPRFWLDPAEPVWRVRAEFVHKDGFGPAELATIRGIPAHLNPHWPAASTDWAVVLKEASISVKGIRREINWGGNAYVETEVTPKPERFRVALVKVTDDRGREVALAKPPRGYGDFRTYPTHSFGITLPEDAKTLDLTFAYEECRFAEFAAKPAATEALSDKAK